MKMNSSSVLDVPYLIDQESYFRMLYPVWHLSLWEHWKLNGVNEFDFTENKKIINEALKFIHLSKFEWCDV